MSADLDASTSSSRASQPAPVPAGTPPAAAASAALRELKRRRILDACRAKDLDGLIALATEPGGFLTDDLRKDAWAVLLGARAEPGETDGARAEESQSADTRAEESKGAGARQVPWQMLPPHRDEEQVKLDVNRSFVYYPENETEKQLDARKADLQSVITEVLRRHPSLCYFQGYHDIVQVFLLVLGPSASPPLVQRLSMLRIRDFLLPKLSASISHLHLLPAILYHADRELYRLLPSNPYYGLSHVLTLYAHDIQSYADIARLFDFLLAREAVASIYLFAVIIMSKREELLEFMADGPDPDVMSVVLQKLPQNVDWEAYIKETVVLYERYPPDRLPLRAWSRISSCSVLKTTLDPVARSKQSLLDGQRWFDKHSKETEKQEARARILHTARRTLYRYRRPITITMSVAVAMLALYLGKDGDVRLPSIVWDRFGLAKLFGMAPKLRRR